MEIARNARVLLKRTNHGVLTLVTKHCNEFFPVSQNLPFILSAEGEIVFYLDKMEIKNRGIKEYNRAGLFVTHNEESAEFMGRLVPLASTDLRCRRLSQQFFLIHRSVDGNSEILNYDFYLFKSDFSRYFFNSVESKSFTLEGLKVFPPVSVIGLSEIAKDYADYNLVTVDSDGFFIEEDQEIVYRPFEKTLNSCEEISLELADLFKRPEMMS